VGIVVEGVLPVWYFAGAVSVSAVVIFVVAVV